MANLKSITELPVAESAEGLNLIVNDNGAAKQIAASAVGAQADWAETDENSPSFVKNKPTQTKELMYEWNFSTEDEVYEIFENVNEDLTWLATKSDDIDWECVITIYGAYETYDDPDYYTVVDPDVTATGACYSNSSDTRYQNSQNMYSYVWIKEPEDFYNGWNIQYDSSEVSINAYNKVHFDDDDGVWTTVDAGGLIVAVSDVPLKSVKIYKITH